MTTKEALELVEKERERQKEIGADGILLESNDLLGAAFAYLGRAFGGVRRNTDDPVEMAVKGTAILIDYIERS